MQFGYVMIIMLSVETDLLTREKEPIIASKRLKISKPYFHKGPRSNLIYKCESTDSKTSKSR